jgi:hypothetical protein
VGGRPSLEDSLIRDLVSIYHSWAAGKAPGSEIASLRDYDKLADNDFVRDPVRYVAASYPAPDPVEARHERDELLTRLNALTQASREADEQLRSILQERQARFDAVRLGDLGVLTITRSFPTQHAVPEGDVRVMSIAALRNQAPPKLLARREAISDAGLETAHPGDVLIAIEGGTVGETMVVPEDIDEFISSQQVAKAASRGAGMVVIGVDAHKRILAEDCQVTRSVGPAYAGITR